MARWGYLAGIGAVVVVAAGVQVARPVGAVSVKTVLKPPAAASALHMAWPNGAESYLAVSPGGTVGEAGPDQAIPVGSVTKMMTAYLLLKKYPLSVYGSGPSVTITAKDVQEYQQDVKSQQSVAMVTEGEKISERKLLEGLLVASGNNIAHIVARWVSGSSASFTQQMNQQAQAFGLTKTHFVGPSGLNPGNVSTPRDETILAEKAMAIPVFREIVAMPQISWPGGKTAIENFNYLVGHDGITGVKTGSTLYAGGCFVFSAPRTVGGQPVTIYGAVLGQQGTQTLSQLLISLHDGESLINQLSAQLHTVPVVQKGETVADIEVPWGQSVSLVAGKSLAPILWPGVKIHETLHWAGAQTGTLEVTAGPRSWEIPVSLSAPVPKPSLTWRIKRGL